MDIAVTSIEQWQIVALIGKFVTKAISQVNKLFNEFEKAGTVNVALDLSRTTHMDSSAITCLLQFYKRIVIKNGKIVLFGANDDITGIITIVGLDHSVPLCKTKLDFQQNFLSNANC